MQFFIPKYRRVFNDYNTLVASLTAAGHINHLYKRGFEGDESYRIGVWAYDANVSGPASLGKVDLSLVTDSATATVDTGGGGAGVNVVTVVSAAALAEGDIITIWDVSAATTLATGRTITDITGQDITFDGAAINVSDADFLHKEGTCEFGELRTYAGGGLWAPSANTVPYWSSGLVGGFSTGDEYIRLPITKFTTDATSELMVVLADITIGTVTAGAGSYVGFGYNATDEVAISSVYNDAGTWKRTQITGALGTATFAALDATGDVSSTTGLFGFMGHPSSTGNLSEVLVANNPAWTAGRSFGNIATAATNFGQGADGPPTDPLFVGLVASGNLPATLSGFRVLHQ